MALNSLVHDTSSPPGRPALWVGRVLSGLVAAMLVMSASGKFAGVPELEANLVHMGFKASILPTLGVIELVSVILYVIPYTAVLGAILVTGYLGGAVVTHMRMDEPVLIPVAVGVVAWLGLFLRDPRLRRLIPLRSL